MREGQGLFPCPLSLFTMVDEHPQTAKESKGIGKRLQKPIRFGHLNTPQKPAKFASTHCLHTWGRYLICPRLSG